MATSYPYDQHEEGQVALRSHASEILSTREEAPERLADAAQQVLTASANSVCPEIAQAMLLCQQANAIIAARTRIVAAAGMVQMALAELEKRTACQPGRGARHRWSATCWSPGVASAAPSRSLTPAACPGITDGRIWMHRALDHRRSRRPLCGGSYPR
jgi:hypothetical protein